ncbi:uncharacterized protein LOC133533014 [Cydia pomonella]|nr:uncharacterized protein LOC133533014 [Cydia pomonella]
MKLQKINSLEIPSYSNTDIPSSWESDSIKSEQNVCEEQPLKTDPDEQFKLSMQFKESPAVLGHSFQRTSAAFLSIERCLESNPDRGSIVDLPEMAEQSHVVNQQPENTFTRSPPFHGDGKLICVGGRLSNFSYNYEPSHPVLLSLIFKFYNSAFLRGDLVKISSQNSTISASVCLATEAAHLLLYSDFNKNAYIAALRRFIAHSFIQTILSDNASTSSQEKSWTAFWLS